MANSINSTMNAYVEKIREQVQKAVDKALEIAIADFMKDIDTDIRNIFEESVRHFYEDYSPNYYNRTYSMYHLLHSELSDDSATFWFEPDEMTSMREGGSLYDLVFKRGWHGGASSNNEEKLVGHPGYLPGGGVMAYRVPVGKWFRWGRAAEVEDVSPYLELMDKRDEYEKGLREKLITKINGQLSKIKIN